jgi:amino acid permease
MKALIKYISLLLFSGLIIPFYNTNITDKLTSKKFTSPLNILFKVPGPHSFKKTANNLIILKLKLVKLQLLD